MHDQLDEKPHPVQQALLNAMTDGQRLQLALEMTKAVLELRFAGLQQDNPGLSERQLLKKFCGELYGTDLAGRAYPGDS